MQDSKVSSVIPTRSELDKLTEGYIGRKRERIAYSRSDARARGRERVKSRRRRKLGGRKEDRRGNGGGRYHAGESRLRLRLREVTQNTARHSWPS